MVPWAMIIPILIALMGGVLFLKLVADELRVLRHSRVLHKQVQDAQRALDRQNA